MTNRRKIRKTLLSGLVALACVSLPLADAVAKKGGGNAGGGNGGDPEPVYTADGPLINGGPIDSTNLSFNDIIFRSTAGFTFDLNGFTLGNCDPFSGTTTGTLVLTTGDSAASEFAAELRFGFQGLLTDGSKSVHYYLIMRGMMTTAWPPSSATTEMAFDSWEIFAENKKDQRNGCYGDGETDMVFTIYQSSP